MVSLEEHNIYGGLGSAIAESLCEEGFPMKIVGIKDRFGISGEPDELFAYFGIKDKDIANACREAIAMKKHKS